MSNNQAVKTGSLVGEASTFEASGVKCAATLYRPSHSAGKVPAMLTIHGWGGVQGLMLTEFLEKFVGLGMAVMTFDYPGWGKSEGKHRHTIHPGKRTGVAEKALEHLKAQTGIDTSRLFVWGTSLGGGHAVEIAASHPELTAVIAQVPMLDGISAVAANPISRMARFSVDITLDLLQPWKTHYLPTIAAKGGYSSMDRDGADRAIEWSKNQPDFEYDNRLAAASLLRMGPYRPIKKLKAIKIPTLLIAARGDTVAPFPERRVRAAASDAVEIRLIDGNHFDPYFSPIAEQNLGFQLEFLRKHLKQ